jgi:hypothetical protein
MTPAPPRFAMGPEAVKARAGCYSAPEGDVLCLFERDGDLFIQGVPLALRALGADCFAVDGDRDLLRLEFEPGGSAATLAVGGAPARHLERCEPTTEVDVETYLGYFTSRDAGEATCRVTARDGDLVVSFANGPMVALRPIAPDRLWSPDFGATLSFARGPDGAASGFRLDGSRVRGIAFVRTGQAPP